MSSTLGDPSLNLTPKVTQRGFHLCSCCMPNKKALDDEEKEFIPLEEKDERELTFDLPESAVEDTTTITTTDYSSGSTESKPIVAENQTNSVLVAFLQVLLSFLLFSFHNTNPQKSIKTSTPESTSTVAAAKQDDEQQDDNNSKVVRENVIVSDHCEDGIEIENVPEIAIAD